MNLTFHDHGVDDVAAIVHGNKTANLDLARTLVNVDHADVGAEGEGQIRRIIVIDRLESRLHPLRHIGVCGEGNVLDALGLAGRPFDKEFARLPVQILLAALQQMSGDLFGLLADLARRHRRSRTGDGSAAAGVGSQAIGSGVGVAFLHRHIGCRNPQLLGDDLGIGRLMSLAPGSWFPCGRWLCLWDERESRRCRTS